MINTVTNILKDDGKDISKCWFRNLFHDKLFNNRYDDLSSIFRVSRGRFERSNNNSEYFSLENKTRRMIYQLAWMHKRKR